MNAIPEIPKGLGDELLKRKYGRQHHKIADLLLRKFAIESILMQDPSEDLKKKLETELRSVFCEIEAITDYLRAWYFAYYNLCSQCHTCTFNHRGQYCTFYGEKKIPHPDSNHPNRVCSKYNPKKNKKILTNN